MEERLRQAWENSKEIVSNVMKILLGRRMAHGEFCLLLATCDGGDVVDGVFSVGQNVTGSKLLQVTRAR